MILKCVVLLALVFQAYANPLLGSQINADLFEGDMKLNVQQGRALTKQDSRTGLLELIRRWPTSLEGFVTIPYRLDPNYTQWHVDWMMDQFRQIESTTCVRFVPRTYQIDWLDIMDVGGCWSYVGRQGGRQEVGMSTGCFFAGVGAHEIMHALGYGHMHNADDRDEYLDIRFENVDPQHHGAFNTYDKRWFSNFNTPYDVLSCMNYNRLSFSMNGEDVIVPRDPQYLHIVGFSSFSAGDATRVNRMYMCQSH